MGGGGGGGGACDAAMRHHMYIEVCVYSYILTATI